MFAKSFWRTFGKQLFLLKVYGELSANYFLWKFSGEISANNFFTKSFWQTFVEQLPILVTLPQSHQKFATESLAATSGGTLATVFRRTKRFAASLPQTSPFGKGNRDMPTWMWMEFKQWRTTIDAFNWRSRLANEGKMNIFILADLYMIAIVKNIWKLI